MHEVRPPPTAAAHGRLLERMRRLAAAAGRLVDEAPPAHRAAYARVSAALAGRLAALGGVDDLVHAYHFDRDRLEAWARAETPGTWLSPLVALDAAVGRRLAELAAS
jgi:hypothetical protein